MRDNIIQEIEERDLEQLYKILIDAFKDTTEFKKFKELYNASKQDKNTHILGYYINDILVGTLLYNILVMPNRKEITIWNVAVNLEFRKRGIATSLMKNVEDIANKENDVSRIWLFSGCNRISAHKLYKKLGYDDEYDKAFIKWINGKEK